VTTVGTIALVGVAFLLLVIVRAGRSRFAPRRLEEVGFERRAASKTEGGVKVDVVALSDDEARGATGVDLPSEGIQPVWVRVENSEPIAFVLPAMTIDREYYSPMEVAWQFHGWFGGATNARIDDHFRGLSLPVRVGPGETVSGFVFTNLDRGIKYVSIELLGRGAQEVRRFFFLAPIPGFTADFHGLNEKDIYQPGQVQDLDSAHFREWVEALPPCVLGGDRKTPGDPLNVAFVGDQSVLFPALARQGWHVTEAISRGSVWRTVASSVFGRPYRYGPVSPLYLFGRPQDIAVQKARGNVDLRNHMRLWLAPVRIDGTQVWVGQISRDIGVRLTKKTITTHKIDPEVDGARWYLMQDMFYSQSLQRFAFAHGVGACTAGEPRGNYTGDPYWTDGLRLVMWLSREPVSYQRVEAEGWVETR
jgi:LssY C-terminus